MTEAELVALFVAILGSDVLDRVCVTETVPVVDRVLETDVVLETDTVAVPVQGGTKLEGEAVGLRDRVGLTVPEGERVLETDALVVHVDLAVICVREPEGERVCVTEVVLEPVPEGLRD